MEWWRARWRGRAIVDEQQPDGGEVIRPVARWKVGEKEEEAQGSGYRGRRRSRIVADRARVAHLRRENLSSMLFLPSIRSYIKGHFNRPTVNEPGCARVRIGNIRRWLYVSSKYTNKFLILPGPFHPFFDSIQVAFSLSGDICEYLCKEMEQHLLFLTFPESFRTG